MLTIVTHSPRETQEVGRSLGREAQGGDLFLLSGPLGGGKTCLTQGIAWGLGVQEYARSPTFVLINQYRGRLPLYHIDLFRIDDPTEALELGLEEYLSSEGVCVVEWADKAADLFPQEHLWVYLDYHGAENQRVLRFTTQSARWQGILDRLEVPRQGNAEETPDVPGH
ncbi:MAG: tRNA (adenosine(37)-N6)-threonylcarbamoyltransferase complex ATPase subunit type 1 TsaE [Dehalococcoidia bacterium]